MKDNVLLPAVITTSLSIMFFMLICIQAQAPLIKDLSDKVEKIQSRIDNLKVCNGLIETQKSYNTNINKEAAQMQRQMDQLKNQLTTMQKDILNLTEQIKMINSKRKIR